ICSFYYREGSVWMLMVRNIGSQAIFSFINVVAPKEGTQFQAELAKYTQSLVIGQPDFHTLRHILDRIGSVLLSRLCFLGPVDWLIIIPHRILNILPLHACGDTDRRGTRHFLDECAKSITYSSSLLELQYGRWWPARAETIGNRYLAVVDAAAKDLMWLRAERAYFEVLRGDGFPVDLVQNFHELPADLHRYARISWSSHASSCCNSWGESFLAFDGHRINALSIAQNWELRGTPDLTLAACNTALDLSISDGMDEYCGLDLAFRIAGARFVAGSLWPVRDDLAAYANMAIWQFEQRYGISMPEAMVLLQQDLRSGAWLTNMPTERQIRTASNLSPNSKEVMWGIVKSLRRLPANEFKSERDWATFRCFGG
ncbi:MAG TPA: CHAT domain-containing protein, partial [Terriglobales bacterium]|nr:CHAT domain-containing protein [Terriglobales bacterium]